MVDFIIAGAGYRGILAAAILRKKGYQVVLIDAANQLGGVLFGGQWKSFQLDLGCHMFDNTNPEHTLLLQEIFGDIMDPIEIRYAGRTAGSWHENFTVPSLRQASVPAAQLLADLIDAKTRPQQPVHNYAHYLANRFGRSAGRLLVDACRKKVHFDPTLLDPVANRVVLFERVNMFEQQITLFLKQLPALDEVLAAESHDDPMRFYPAAKAVYPYRNFYPRGGTNQFCLRAGQYLQQIGVQVLPGRKIEQFTDGLVTLDNNEQIRCKKLFWTLELEKAEKLLTSASALEPFIHPVPMVLVYFEVPISAISDYTYVHDHSDDTACFRISAPGKYSRQVINGLSYICCEIPTSLDTAYWQHPDLFIEQFWQEAQLMRLIKPGARYSDVKIMKAPVTFKLPKLGFSAVEQQVRHRLNAQPNLILTDTSYFSTQDIAAVIHRELEEL